MLLELSLGEVYMIDLQKKFRKQVLSVCCAIMAIAFVLSTGTKVLAVVVATLPQT